VQIATLSDTKYTLLETNRGFIIIIIIVIIIVVFGRSQQNPITTQAYTSKLPKMAQPDLDYVAPEVQTHSFCNPNSDVFAFALLVCSLYNNGRSPLESNLSTSQYVRQLELVR
jgi:uncharacterized alpha/beta hydrolase family protein